jgi:CRP-like cAMP-binding protein
VRQDGDETLVIAALSPGDTIGEVSLVLRRNAAADVVAVHPTITLFLPKEDFLDLIQHHPLLLAQLYHLAVHRDDETSSIAAQDAVLAEGDDFILL